MLFLKVREEQTILSEGTLNVNGLSNISTLQQGSKARFLALEIKAVSSI